MKPCLVGPPNGWVMVERSDRMWSTGEGNGKQLQYSCLENSRKNEGMELKPKEKKKKNTQLWMGLVIEARSDAVKSNIA